jgi:aromatic ring-cleaving dioxygenase
MQQPPVSETISGYHAHVYYDAGSRERAAQLRSWIEARFDVRMGPWRDGPAGPHLAAQYQIAFAPDQFPTLVPFLLMNRMELTVLVHPQTGSALDSHTLNAVWMGAVLPVDTEFLRGFDAAEAGAATPPARSCLYS